MARLYLADSVRSEEGGAKYLPVVREHAVTATRRHRDGHEPKDYWTGDLPFGSSMGEFASESEALAAVELECVRRGWQVNKQAAKALAQVIAERRNGPICSALRKLRRQHKNNLHLVLGLSHGQGSVLTLRAWISGAVKVPETWLARWRGEGLLPSTKE